MDNFMDKLAEKYNAQDMIRANSQAESAQMQNLQDQVEAYEAVLQEMRKLNYKNTELTEKMYALVDESIEKVRTLQIEAEGGANTEQVSKEMTDAVNRAMSEAVSNMDENMVRSLTRTLEDALVQPADQLRQSTEDVKNSVVAVQSSADDMRSGVDRVKSSMEDLTAGMELVTSGMENLKGSVEQLSDGVGSVKEEIGGVKDEIGGMQDKLFAIQQTGSNTEETISSMAAAVKELGEQLDRMQRDTLDGISERMEGMKSMPSEESSNDNEILEKISASIEELKQQAQLSSLIQETLSSLAQAGSKTQDSITELKTAVGNLKEGNNGSLEAAKAAADAGEAAKNGLAELKTANDENRSALEDIFHVLQATKSDVAELKAGVASRSESSGNEEELVKTLSDLMANNTEVSANIRNLKQATDENKNTLKSALDSSIYGLKQDNKEIVEFLQRMNANLIKKTEDEEAEEQKKAEEASKAEAERKLLDERFKAAEDFMHKESVKVYRNVQAVINEKNDKQKESVENANLSVEKRVGKVKALVVINMVFTLINLATIILYIFGFLGAH